ncbi:MAG: adenine deaminase [Bacteroidota bacterium]
MKLFKGNIIDVFNREIIPGELIVDNGIIQEIRKINEKVDYYILPGFVDSHVHIESSMLTPVAFARQAVKHGTVAAVCDPHEIANVCGIEGISFMIENGNSSKMKLFFGAPSCVPATDFETNGAEITKYDIKYLFEKYPVKIALLSEVMNFPGVIHSERDIMEKIKISKSFNKKIDGHAPGLKGEDLIKYVQAGIETDHECTSYREAEDKIKAGMKIIIREGSAAKNFGELIPLIRYYPEKIMFCTDDFHPDDLIKGHINQLVKKSYDLGYDLYDIIRASSVNPILHYGLPVGLLRKNDKADFIIVNNLKEWEIIDTMIDGKSSKSFDEENAEKATRHVNNFRRTMIDIASLKVKPESKNIRVITTKDKELYTGENIVVPKIEDGYVVTDTVRDILKLVVLSRYDNRKPKIGFVQGFGLKEGAVASSIAHDSHNIICLGVKDEDITGAVRGIIKHQGGIVAVNNNKIFELPLNIGGLMTDSAPGKVAADYSKVNSLLKEWGCMLNAPVMTLSFLSLLVIPELKLSDMGLFDVGQFKYVDLFHE